MIVVILPMKSEKSLSLSLQIVILDEDLKISR